MGLARTISRSSLLGHPGRTLFSILGVAMGIATVVAVFTVDHVTVLSRTQTLGEQDFGADLEVRATEEAQDPLAELLALEGVAGVAAFFQNDVRIRPVAAAGADDEPRRARLIALEGTQAASLGIYHVEAGTDLDPGRSGTPQCLIGRNLAETLALSPGDKVYLAPPARAARKKCVDGEMQRTKNAKAPPPEELFEVAGILGREGIGRRSKGEVVVLELEAGRGLYRNVFVEPHYWLKRDRNIDMETLEADLGRAFSFERNQSAAVGQMADERAFRNGVRMAGLFALLLGLFVIFHTLSMSLLERVREVVGLHALGTTRVQIARVFLTEATVIAVSAGILGFALGLGIAALLLRNGITTLGVTGHATGPFEVPWRLTLPLTLLGVGIALVGSVFPILTARATDVSAVLRGEESGRQQRHGHGFHIIAVLLLIIVLPASFFLLVPIVGAAVTALVQTVVLGLSVLGALFALALFMPGVLGSVTSRAASLFRHRYPLASMLASRSLSRNPTRIGASVAAIALVTAAFVGLEGMTNSLRAELEVWGEAALVDKAFISGLPNAPIDELQGLLYDLPGVVGVESGDVRAHVGFLLMGMRIDELARYGPLAEDPGLVRALQEEQGIIVSERLARQRELSVGDPVAFNTSGHGVQVFRVVCVSDAYGYFLHPDERAYGLASDRFLERYFCLDILTTSMGSARLGPDADIYAIDAVLRAAYPKARNLAVRTGGDVLDIHLADIEVDFVLFDIILLLTAVLAGLGVLNGQLLSALERRKELGVLRALGMTRRQLGGAVLLESGILGITGGVLGLVVGSALTPVIVSALRVLSGLDLPLRGAGPALTLFLFGACALALLAGLYPIWRMNRMDAVRAVRTG